MAKDKVLLFSRLSLEAGVRYPAVLSPKNRHTARNKIYFLFSALPLTSWTRSASLVSPSIKDSHKFPLLQGAAPRLN